MLFAKIQVKLLMTFYFIINGQTKKQNNTI